MEIPSILAWLIVILSIGWAIFGILVMVAVLQVAREALPYFQRENARHQMALIERDRAKGITVSTKY